MDNRFTLLLKAKLVCVIYFFSFSYTNAQISIQDARQQAYKLAMEARENKDLGVDIANDKIEEIISDRSSVSDEMENNPAKVLGIMADESDNKHIKIDLPGEKNIEIEDLEIANDEVDTNMLNNSINDETTVVDKETTLNTTSNLATGFRSLEINSIDENKQELNDIVVDEIPSTTQNTFDVKESIESKIEVDPMEEVAIEKPEVTVDVEEPVFDVDDPMVEVAEMNTKPIEVDRPAVETPAVTEESTINTPRPEISMTEILMEKASKKNVPVKPSMSLHGEEIKPEIKMEEPIIEADVNEILSLDEQMLQNALIDEEDFGETETIEIEAEEFEISESEEVNKMEKLLVETPMENAEDIVVIEEEIIETVEEEPARMQAYAFSAENHQGEMINLEDMKGSVVVMNFWWPGCRMCLEEIPELNKMVEKYQDQDVIFMALCLENAESAQKVLNKHNFKYDHFVNAREIAHNYNIFLYPGHVVIDKKGGLMLTNSGNTASLLEKIDHLIQEGLNE